MNPNISELEKATDKLNDAIERYETLLEKDKTDAQEVAFYAAKLNMYGNSSLELTKALMTLSSAAIALLIALPAYKGDTALAGFSLLATIFSFSAFILCICCTVYILKENGNFLVESLNDESKASCLACKLKFAERCAIATFALGIISAISLTTHERIIQKAPDDREKSTLQTTSSETSTKP